MKTVIHLILFTLVTHSMTTSAVSQKEILNHYSDIAFRAYSDSLQTAQKLQIAVEELVSEPSEMALEKAKTAWVSARVPYQQTEAFRFGNSIVDDWEGQVNAWPLDEGLIDYVAASYGDFSDDNSYYVANVISAKAIKLSGKTIDTSTITPSFLKNVLHEADGIEANVATGYHAIEFLLWGQDLNRTGPGAGNRPFTDYDTQQCSNKNCGRRIQYLKAAVKLLVTDLQWMVKQWGVEGKARLTLIGEEQKGIAAILNGMGSLSYGELAGERIKLGLILNDPEEEHDCFSDNTHNAHFYNVQGIENVYLGRYLTVSGKTLEGPSLSKLVAEKNKKLDSQMRERMRASLDAAQALVASAEDEGVFYDQLLAEGNISGNAKIMNLVDALLDQTKQIELVADTLLPSKISFAGSDVLSSPDSVFE